MKIKTVLITSISLLMINACNNQPKLTDGLDITNLDTTVTAQDDFYQYACGGWMKNNPISDEYSRFGAFDQIGENTKLNLKTLITEIASKDDYEEGTNEQKIGDLYNLAMDSTRLNNEAASPIKPYLEELSSVKNRKELFSTFLDLQKKGVISGMLSIYVSADPSSSNVNLVQTYQGGYTLGSRDYYIDKDAKTLKIREAYIKHITKMFVLSGFTEKQAAQKAKSVLKIETPLAKAAYDNVKLRDPYLNYNKMTIEELSKKEPLLDWDAYLSAIGLKGVKELSIGQKEHLHEAVQLMNKANVKDLVAYLQWQTIDGAASLLGDDMYAENFNFNGKILSGKKASSPRWKRAVSIVNSSLGDPVGQMYVHKYFPPEAKERMLKLVHNLQISLGQRILAQEWMSQTTKDKALEKLAAYKIKIGYPDKWKDFSSLTIDSKNSFYENMLKVKRFMIADNYSDFGKPVDREKWGMTPQTVNAYYNPGTNEICFPAAILQRPFFDMNADDAFNYGAIGVVIGHEMTHGFDDQGSLFDKEGNLNDWWTKEDRAGFKKRTQVMVDHFNSIEVAPGVYGNGAFTLGENIADHGGLEISYQAFLNATSGSSEPIYVTDENGNKIEQARKSKLPVSHGFTPEQRFFLAYAGVWAQNIRPEEILLRTKTDEHSLGKWRVNGALPEIAAWYKAFNVKKDNKLYIAPEDRVNIW